MVLRLFTPVAKLWTAKLCVQVTSEGVESFGGAGYIEDTGLPVLLRNAQVFPIWEGTTNVLSLDVLRVLERSPEALSVFAKEVRRITDTSKNCSPEVRATIGVRLEQLQKWSATLLTQRNEVQQRYARHFAFYLGELYSQALLVELGEASDFKQIKNLVSLIPNQKFEILPSFENSQATEWMFE